MAALRWSHRWVSIVAGIVLLAITTSGAVLVLEPELRQAAHPSHFASTPTDHPISLHAAAGAARRAHPDAGDVTRVVRNRGVYQVALGASPETLVSVDPGTGRVLGADRPERGVLGFLVNLHECGLTCEGYPGHVAFLSRPMPDVGVPGLAKLQVGGFLLAVLGGVLLLLVLSGAVLWWPGLRRWRRGFRIRRGQGRYKRDYDLHKVVGVVALPFLGMWAITGMNFELPVVSRAVYAVIGGAPGDEPTMTSKPAPRGTPDIGVDAAAAAAARTVPRGRVTGVGLPDAGDATSTYVVWLSRGVDPVGYSDYAGVIGVGVDRHDGVARQLYGRTDAPVQQKIWGSWTTGVHFGMVVGWIPRLLWVLLGLTPLLLAVTGMSTWLYKRGKRRARKRRVAASRG